MWYITAQLEKGPSRTFFQPNKLRTQRVPCLAKACALLFLDLLTWLKFTNRKLWSKALQSFRIFPTSDRSSCSKASPLIRLLASLSTIILQKPILAAREIPLRVANASITSALQLPWTIWDRAAIRLPLWSLIIITTPIPDLSWWINSSISVNFVNIHMGYLPYHSDLLLFMPKVSSAV